MSSACLQMHAGMIRLVPADPARVTVSQTESASPRTEEQKQAAQRAREEAAAALAAEREKYARLRQTLDARIGQFMREAETQIREQLIAMALRISEIILKRELPDRDMVRTVILETLEPVSDLQGVKVRLNPDDADALLKAQDASDTAERLPRHLEIVADRDLAPGDALIESRNGYFDARLRERLTLLEERLRERSRNRPVKMTNGE